MQSLVLLPRKKIVNRNARAYFSRARRCEASWRFENAFFSHKGIMGIELNILVKILDGDRGYGMLGIESECD
jgi:hypothetical protein